MLTTLKYMNRAMSAVPCNMALENVAFFLREGKSVYVDLQPGDATRYDLLITPLPGIVRELRNEGYRGLPTYGPEFSLMVTRMRGGDFVGSVVIGKNTFWGYALETLADGNDWTATLLSWWLECLYDVF